MIDLDEVKETTFKYLKTIAMDIVVVLVALGYVFYQMVTLKPTELNPLVLIAQSLMGIICGVTIKTALGENGFNKGYNSAIWQEEEKKYNEACDTAVDYIELVGNYYLVRELEKKANYRRVQLQGVRLKYSDWFDKQGNYIATPEMWEKLDRKQKRVVNKCLRVKIYVLNLFSEYQVSSEQATQKEMTDKRQRKKNIARNTLSAVIVAVIGVYFIPSFNWNVATLISSSMQVTLWILLGVLQLYTNFNFVVKDRVAILRTKKEEIARFVKNSQDGQYKKSIYDEYEEKPIEA